MPKRTFWLFGGIAFGAGSSLWIERRVRRTVQETAARLAPDALVVEVGRSIRQAAESASELVRNAIAAGRDEMHEHEQRLWAQLSEGGNDPEGQPDALPDARLRQAGAARLPSYLDN